MQEPGLQAPYRTPGTWPLAGELENSGLAYVTSHLLGAIWDLSAKDLI